MASARTHSFSVSEYSLVMEPRKPGKVKERMPTVRTSVTATAKPQSHHSRPSTWRMRRSLASVPLADRTGSLNLAQPVLFGVHSIWINTILDDQKRGESYRSLRR